MENRQQIKEIALIIIRAAVKTHGRAYVRHLISKYKATKPDYQEAIEEAFNEFARGRKW